MLEDSGAVLGILVASAMISHFCPLPKNLLFSVAACLVTSRLTENPIWDSVGSVVIGVLMGGVAAFLIRMNRSFLIGSSLRGWQSIEGKKNHFRTFH